MLRVLPRGGGVLDQPSDEIVRLEAMFEAFTRYEKLEQQRDKARHRNRSRHSSES